MSDTDDPTQTPSRRRKRPRPAMSQTTRDEIVHLHQQHYGTRRIATRVGRSRKQVRTVLQQQGCSHGQPPSPASKLDPFREAIEDKARLGLTTTRLLREIRGLGYQGGRTILADHARTLRAQFALAPAHNKVKRRFETRPGEEIQIDWSPYTVPIAGRPTTVNALGCLLCYSRKLALYFFRDERQPTLLEGLAMCFEYLDGVTIRVVLDNMATAVLGRLSSHEVLWHPRFLEFAAHYGFKPFACRVRDPDRKGKKEKSFRLVWDDFLKGADFDSWDDLDRRRRVWLDETPAAANQRIHGTTRQVPNEAYRGERDLLIRLPRDRFPVYDQDVRVVDQDATLSIRGTRYSVPATLGNHAVAVRLYASHFEVLDRHSHIAFSRRYVADADKGKLIIDPTHYANLPRRPRGSGGGGGSERLDEAFLARFPTLAPLLDGLKRRMKTLWPIHLRALLRLVDRYGEEAFRTAATRAQEYRRCDAQAVARILAQQNPLEPLDPIPPLGGVGPAVLGEVAPPSLDGYGQLDHVPPASPTTRNDTEDDHGA
ncbi:MAG: IS21 family transposase [Chloroflexi bacterium]|nr:IS21 family transposase [Chloroflexota bacterium]